MVKYVLQKYPAYTFLEEGNAVPLIRGLRVVDMEDAYQKNRGLGENFGFVEFFSRKFRRFPTGLLEKAIQCIKEFSPDAEIIIKDNVTNRKELSSVPKDILQGIELWDFQLKGVNDCLAKHTGVILVGTGGGKLVVLASMLAELVSKNLTALIMVPTTPILMNTANKIEKYLGFKPGIYGGKQRTIKDVTVITNQSLDSFMRNHPYEIDSPKGRAEVSFEKDTELKEFLEKVDALFIDEVHLTTAPAWYRAAMTSNAWFRIGFTGTLEEDSEIRMMRLQAATGNIVLRKPAHELIKEGYLAVPYIHTITDEEIFGDYEMPIFTACSDATEFYRELYKAAIVRNKKYNVCIAKLVKELDDKGKAVLVICQMKEHFTKLQNLFENRGIRYYPCWGATSLANRVEAMNNVERNGSGVILATKIFDIGVDIPVLDAVILTAGGKAAISTRQRAGRGLRAKKGKDNLVHIFDFMNNSTKKLAEHSLLRWEVYEKEKFNIVPEENFKLLLRKIRDGKL